MAANPSTHLSGSAGTPSGRASNGFTIWFTGLSGSGKSTVTAILERELRARGLRVEVLDGDAVRTNLTHGLGFSREDRNTNIRRVGWVCEILSRNDVVAIAAVISPYRRRGMRFEAGSVASSKFIWKLPSRCLRSAT